MDVLVVGDEQRQCELKESRRPRYAPPPIAQVTWVVVGSCPADERKGADDRRSTEDRHEDEHDRSIRPLRNEQLPCSKSTYPLPYGPWTGQSATPACESIPETVKGHYRYKVKINKTADAGTPNYGQEGDFLLCPVWPCRLYVAMPGRGVLPRSRQGRRVAAFHISRNLS